MRSRTGCHTCRQRKLKCDEAVPTCGQCAKAARRCVPFQGSIFRHHNPTNKNAHVSHSSRSKNSRAGARRSNQRATGARSYTFVHIINPLADEKGQHDECSFMASSPLQYGVQELENSIRSVPVTMPTDTTRGESACGENELSCHVSQSGDGFEPFPRAVSAVRSVNQDWGKWGNETRDVLSFQLLRYFKEVPGKWMDLFDVTAFFTFYIPRVAAIRPLLKNACCALASKHIFRLSQIRGLDFVTTVPHFDSKYWRISLRNHDWHYESIAYYDETLRLLKREVDVLQLNGGSPSSIDGQSDLLATIAILCTYELLSAPGPEWTAHLSALPMLEIAPLQFLESLSTTPRPRYLSGRSIFWNLAKQDCLYAFINETHTKLDWSNLQFWRETGLCVSDSGVLLPDRLPTISEGEAVWPADEDVFSHALSWLLGKVVNFVTEVDCSSVNYDDIMTLWTDLDLEVQSWFDKLPQTFQSVIRTPLLETETRDASTKHLDEYERIWYAIPTCAATMQNYHMARILLLVNKPHVSTIRRSNVTERLNSYRITQELVSRHSREICGISLSHPTDSVRIQSVQPLFVAGQCLQTRTERCIVLDLLRDIEQDLGWATEYRIQKLEQEWGMQQDT